MHVSKVMNDILIFLKSSNINYVYRNKLEINN